MTQKYIFIVNYWIPFPESEMSGVLCVIGESDNEVHDILLDWRPERLSKYDSQIMNNVVNAQRFLLSDEEESRIVEEFIT